MTELEEKLKKLIVTDLEPLCMFNSIEEIEDFGREINFKFPEDYKNFLFTYGACVFYNNTAFQLPEVSNITNSKGQCMTAAFHGSEITGKIADMYRMIKDDYLRIGELGWYSLFMGMRGEKYGKIYIFAFDEDYRDGTSYFPAADSFTELIMNTVFTDE